MKQNNPQSTLWLSRNPFLVILAALVSGIVLRQMCLSVPPSIWIIYAAVFCLLTIMLSAVRSIHVLLPYLRMGAMFLSFAMLGALATAGADVRNAPSWFGHFLRRSTALKVRVTGPGIIKTKTILVPVAVDAVRCDSAWIATSGELKLYLYRSGSDTVYGTGQILLIPNELSAIKNSGNPFAFDVAGLSACKGLYHQAFLSAKDICPLPSTIRKSGQLDKLKAALVLSINKNVQDSTTRGLIAATLLNERSELDPELMNAYSNTGITHIIAISGMHIVLLAGIILWLLNIIPTAKGKVLKYGISIVMVWLYIALTGFPPSAVRAAVMFHLVAMGMMMDRKADPVNNWAAAGVLILVYNPYWLYDVGIQLSFLAVLSILLFYSPVKQWVTPANKVLAWLWDVVAVSIAAQILVFPLVIYYFHQFPLLGIAANVPAALYSTLLMFGALILFVLDVIGCPAGWLGQLLTWLTHIFNSIIGFLADRTPQLTRDLQIDKIEYWLMMGVVIAACIGCYHKKGNYLLAGMMLSVCWAGFGLRKDYLASRQERIIVYNTSKTSQADWFRGRRVSHLFPPDAAQAKYHTQPAMLGYRIRSEELLPTRQYPLLHMGKSKVLFFGKNSVVAQGYFPIDYLVVSSGCSFDAATWRDCFRPRLVILDGSISRRKAQQWRQQLLDAGLKVHWVQEDGAWILPGT